VSAAVWGNPFWRRWVAANALAELVGLGVVAWAGFFVFQRVGEPQTAAQAAGFVALFVALGAFEGAVVGVAQRSVLRERLPAVRGWVGATVAGAMAAWAIGMLPSTLMGLGEKTAAAPQAEPSLALVLLLAAAMGAVAGPVLAAFQWLSLRRAHCRRAGWWLPANAAAWALGMPVVFLGAQANDLTGDPVLIATAVGGSLLGTGAVVGAVHGRFLLWMLEKA